jgi:hypothetical protein
MKKARTLPLVVLLVPVLAAPTPALRGVVWAGECSPSAGGACSPCGETAPCGTCTDAADGDDAAACDFCVGCQCGVGVLAFTCSLAPPAGVTAPPAPSRSVLESIAHPPSPPPPKRSPVKS